jgi:hypothetical protein
VWTQLVDVLHLIYWQGQHVCDTLLDGTEVAKDSKTQNQISTLKPLLESGDNLSLVQSSDEEHIPLLENQLVNMKPIVTKTVWSNLHSYRLRFQLEGGPIFHTHLPICGATFHKAFKNVHYEEKPPKVQCSLS